MLMKPEFSSTENTQLSYFIKISPVGAEFFHVDRRTDKTKVMVALNSFANVPKKQYL